VGRQEEEQKIAFELGYLHLRFHLTALFHLIRTASIDTEPGTVQRKAKSTVGDLPRWNDDFLSFARADEGLAIILI